MIVTVVVETESGTHSYTGHIVSRGPAMMEMLLTEPFSLAGRCVQFPAAAVLSERSESERSPGARAPV